jgi:hypothetical protein
MRDPRVLSDLVRDPNVVGRCCKRDCDGFLRATISNQPAVVVCDKCGDRQLKLSRIFKKREHKKIRTDKDRRASFWTAWRESEKAAGEFLLATFGTRWKTSRGREEIAQILGIYSKSDRCAYAVALSEAFRQGADR